jgi:hypothetical protein
VQQLADSFSLAEDAQAIAVKLIEECDVFAHLSQARFACLLSQPAVTLQGDARMAIVCIPTVQGPLKRFFDWVVAYIATPVLDWEEPDFLIVIDAACWPGLDAVRKERLVFHELKHVVARETEYGVPKLDREGRPMLRLVKHDIEAFEDEIVRYGISVCALEDACIAIAEGVRKDRRDAEEARGRVA